MVQTFSFYLLLPYSREEKLEDPAEGKKATFIARNRSLSRLRDVILEILNRVFVTIPTC